MSDPEKRKAYQKAYYERNKARLLEKQRERGKRNYAAKPETYRARSKAWKEANPERYRELQRSNRVQNGDAMRARERQWYLDNKERASASARRVKLKSYGLTEEAYQTMVEAQNGVCAICQRPPKRARLYVDHCHLTSRVRGLLCHPCNAAIGLLQENLDTIARAMIYLNNG